MPRKPRFVIPGEAQHVIIRGINREPIFYDKPDYHCYLTHLNEALVKFQCTLHAYVLMTNHVHFLISPSDTIGISKTIQSLGRQYVQYFNYTYERTGSLWEGRYKASLIDTEHYLLACYRYIELNPVRAQMVEHPSDYPWSSYMFNALGKENKLITPHYKYKESGKDLLEQQRAYRALFKAHIPKKQLDEIREATNKEWVLGSDYFKNKISEKLKRQVSPLARGGDWRSRQFKNVDFNRH